MRDNLAQPRGPKASPVDANQMANRLLIIAGRRLGVRLLVASSVNTTSGVLDGPIAGRLTNIVRVETSELALRAVQIGWHYVK